MKRARITQTRMAGKDHAVHTIEGGSGGYRREPCGGCPWRVDQTGAFPASAFVHSARTAYDMALHTFACHESGAEKPATCAGFLLRGSAHNMSVRMGLASGRYGLDVTDGGHALHHDYRSMAVANGVSPRHPALRACRDNPHHEDEEY